MTTPPSADPADPGPPPGAGEPPRPGPDQADARAAITHAWIRSLAPTGYTPLPKPDFDRLLARLVDDLAEAIATDPVAEVLAEAAGAVLIRASFTDSASLRASVHTVGVGLLDLAVSAGLRDPVDRVFAVLGAFAAGYTAALRDWLFDQQEEVKQALHRATGEAERRLRRSEAWFREVFVRAPVGFAISDVNGKLAQVNPALAEIIGCDTEDLVGRSLAEFFHPQDAIEIQEDYQAAAEVGGTPLRRRRRLIRPDGLLIWAYLAVAVLRDTDDQPTLHLTTIENVSDLHLLQDLTTHQALHDVLTGLPNRQYLLSQLQSLLAGQGPGEQVTLYHLDLDGFTAINAGLGPEQADKLLGVVARRLESIFAERHALVARLAGDEFAVLLPSGSSPAEVLSTVSRINEQLAEPVHVRAGGVGLSACIGVAHGQVGALEPFELLRTADVTLRRAKAVGNRQWAVYDPDRDALDRRRFALAATLSGALEFGELEVRWQLWTALADGAPAGISARVRWDHPEHGEVDHYECLDLAEMTGAAVPMGAWLIRAACAQAARWHAELGRRTPAIGVGLTVTQVADPDLVGTVRAALDETGLPPEALVLGTPSVAFLSADGEARDNVSVLTGMGVGVLLTDAGVAPGELVPMARWPIMAVQFAESFVRELAELPADAMVARATEALVHTLAESRHPVVVPGVRTEEQVRWWRATGAVAACGPYFGSAITAAELADRLTRQR